MHTPNRKKQVEEILTTIAESAPDDGPREVAPSEPAGPCSLRCDGVVGGNEPLSPELQELKQAYEVAALACNERQPMPNDGISNRLVAEACEHMGEGHAKQRNWSACAHAHRMACWYYRKALAE